MQVVVAASSSGFTIEGNGDALPGIAAQVDGNRLAGSRTGDFVIDILGAFVVPLAQDSPGGSAIGGNQHDKLVVSLLSGVNSLQCTRILGQSQIEGELHIVLHRKGRSDQPVIAVGAIDVNSGMVVEHAVGGAEVPTASSGSQRCAAHHSAQQTGVSSPAVRNGCGGKTLIHRDAGSRVEVAGDIVLAVVDLHIVGRERIQAGKSNSGSSVDGLLKVFRLG